MKTIVNARFLTQNITGVQRHAMELSLRLKKLRPEMEFVSPSNIIHWDAFYSLKAGIIGRNRGHLWEQFDLPRFLKENSHATLVNLANTAPLRAGNSMVTIHDLGFLRNPSWYSRKFNYLYRFLIPRLARSSGRIITNSYFSRREIREFLNIPEYKVAVVYCGVSEIFQTTSNDNDGPDYGDYILTVSSLNPRKNLIGTIRAFESLSLKDIKLVIVGTSHKTFAVSAIKELAINNSNIIQTGYVSDKELAGLYRKARLLVFPSFYEGFGLPPLEAMACGCPCVVSDTASLPEVCDRAVLYCNPYDIGDIADKMKKVLVDEGLRNELITLGLKRAKSFKWEDSARNFLALLEKENITV